jgi:hypothetical protein
MKRNICTIVCVLTLWLGNTAARAQIREQQASLRSPSLPLAWEMTGAGGGPGHNMLDQGLSLGSGSVEPSGSERPDSGNDIDAQISDTSKTTDTLRQQADQWKTEKALLEGALAEAKVQLALKQKEVDSLKSIPGAQALRIDSLQTVNTSLERTIRELRESLGQSASRADMRYLLTGTEDQLEQMGVIETKGGFFSKEVYLPTSNAYERRFDSVDIHKGRIDVGAPIIALVPERPDVSYEILGPEKRVLQILRPEVFWRLNHLIIVTENKRNSAFQR